VFHNTTKKRQRNPLVTIWSSYKTTSYFETSN
jgi:hypothetical protein